MKFYLAFFLIMIQFHQAFAGSPYETSMPREGQILLAGACGIALSCYLHNQLNPLSEADIQQLSSCNINRFDRVAAKQYSEKAASFSDYLLILNSLLPALHIFNDSAIDDRATLSAIYLESFLINYALTSVIKNTVKRARPFVYNENAPLPDKLQKEARLSFFSGHTSTAFTGAALFATLYSEYHPDSRWKNQVWFLSLTSASITGYLRVKAGKHFPTDVIAGAIVGTLSGCLIPKLHRTHTADALPGTNISLLNISLQF